MEDSKGTNFLEIRNINTNTSVERVREVRITHPQRRKNKLAIIKGTIMGIIIILTAINGMYGFGLPYSDVDCLIDYAHSLTTPINNYLQHNVTARNFLLIFSSIYMDILVLGISIFWSLTGKSWRFLATTLIFYFFRGIVQSIFQMGFPEGFIWDYPGFPSLTVNYLKTNDFFFSGHVGMPIIAALEFNKNGKNYLAVFALCGCLVEFLMMIFTRVHYIIDLITGVIVAHYIFILVDRYIHFIDDSRISLKDLAESSKEEELDETACERSRGINDVRVLY